MHAVGGVAACNRLCGCAVRGCARCAFDVPDPAPPTSRGDARPAQATVCDPHPTPPHPTLPHPTLPHPALPHPRNRTEASQAPGSVPDPMAALEAAAAGAHVAGLSPAKAPPPASAPALAPAPVPGPVRAPGEDMVFVSAGAVSAAGHAGAVPGAGVAVAPTAAVRTFPTGGSGVAAAAAPAAPGPGGEGWLDAVGAHVFGAYGIAPDAAFPAAHVPPKAAVVSMAPNPDHERERKQVGGRVGRRVQVHPRSVCGGAAVCARACGCVCLCAPACCCGCSCR